MNEHAVAAALIDFQTIAILFGMMMLVAHLRIAGFFGWLGTVTVVLRLA